MRNCNITLTLKQVNSILHLKGGKERIYYKKYIAMIFDSDIEFINFNVEMCIQNPSPKKFELSVKH